MSKEELKACPFCSCPSNELTIKSIPDDMGGTFATSVSCQACGCRMGWKSMPDDKDIDAKKMWNQRDIEGQARAYEQEIKDLTRKTEVLEKANKHHYEKRVVCEQEIKELREEVSELQHHGRVSVKAVDRLHELGREQARDIADYRDEVKELREQLAAYNGKSLNQIKAEALNELIDSGLVSDANPDGSEWSIIEVEDIKQHIKKLKGEK